MQVDTWTSGVFGLTYRVHNNKNKNLFNLSHSQDVTSLDTSAVNKHMSIQCLWSLCNLSKKKTADHSAQKLRSLLHCYSLYTEELNPSPEISQNSGRWKALYRHLTGLPFVNTLGLHPHLHKCLFMSIFKNKTKSNEYRKENILLSVVVQFNVALCPQRPLGLFGTGSPGWPPQLSHCSWAVSSRAAIAYT